MQNLNKVREKHMIEVQRHGQEKVIVLIGDLTFLTISSVYKDIKSSLKSSASSEITGVDLAQVKHSDSAGLALLLALLRNARRHHRPFHLYNIPENLLALAKVTSVDKVLLANGKKRKN